MSQNNLFSTATTINVFKHPFVEIIGQSSPFWLDYETKLRGDSQSPSLIQYLDRVLTPSSQTKSGRINMKWLSQSMDSILIPVAPDQEDVREALAHAKRLNLAGAVKVKFVINRWPNRVRQQAAALEKLEGLPESDSMVQGIHLWSFLGIAYDFVYIVLAPI